MSKSPMKSADRIIRDLLQQRKIAASKLIPWSASKPARRGVWLGAKWQHAGFYHVMRYTGETCKYLREQNNEYWSGPYPSSEEWMLYVRPPAAKEGGE